MTEEEVVHRFGLVLLGRGDDPPTDGVVTDGVVTDGVVADTVMTDTVMSDNCPITDGVMTDEERLPPTSARLPAASLTQPLKYFGGKGYLAKRIIDLMPPHLHYVEPYAGGLAVLLARDPYDERLWLPPHKGVSEVVNDVDLRLTNFWEVLADPDRFERFRRIVEAIPLSQPGWEKARAHRYGSDPVADAVAFFVFARQSRAGAMKSFTPTTRTRTRREMNDNVSGWLGAVEGLPDVHARLRRVKVKSMDGAKLIGKEDTPDTFFYVDAPYVHDTRTTRDAYEFEMTDDQHVKLVDTLVRIKGKAIVSMYHHEIYDVLHERHGWRLAAEIPIANHAAGGKAKREMIECLWANYDPDGGRP
jgi:DNA adenine methylase